MSRDKGCDSKKSIWIDLDHLPHVQIYAPIIEELSNSYNVLITTRQYGQTVDLLRMKGLDFEVIGEHPGSGLFNKVWGNLSRAFSLWRWSKGKGISLAACNGSRALILASWLAGIDSVVSFDYEHAEKILKKYFSTYLLVPSKLGKRYLIEIGFPGHKTYEYPGLKENIYLPFFKPDSSIVERLSLDSGYVNILLRTPSDISHYNAHITYELFEKLALFLANTGQVKVYLLLRYKSQRQKYKQIIEHEAIQLIEKMEDGLNLVYHMDMVVGGGGTMNREAAAMGVPCYSVFMGKKPRVDLALQEEGRLTFIENTSDFEKIQIEKRAHDDEQVTDMTAFNYIVDFIRTRAG